MMDALLGLVALVTAVSLFSALRGYVVDSTRERLFALREELFDLGQEIGVDHPDYRVAEAVLNAQIRTAHRTSSLRLAPLVATIIRLQMDRVMAPPATDPRVADIRRRVGAEGARMMLLMAPLLTFGTVLYMLVRLTRRQAPAARSLSQAARSDVSQPVTAPPAWAHRESFIAAQHLARSARAFGEATA